MQDHDSATGDSDQPQDKNGSGTSSAFGRMLREDKCLVALPFRWHDLPAEDCGSTLPEITPAEIFTVGRRMVHLDEFIQYSTYGLIVCGMPSDPALEIAGAVRRVLRTFPFLTAMPLVIPPRLRTGRFRGQAWAIVPAVTTIALFTDGSNLAAAVWFQDVYGLPTDQCVLDALAKMDTGLQCPNGAS